MTDRYCDIRICDTVARCILPRARAEMVCRLVHQHRLVPSVAAERLGLSRAAVSQYLRRKRGCAGPEVTQEMDDLIDLWARAVAGEEASLTICDLCRSAGYVTSCEKNNVLVEYSSP